jgi:hypothetical protein
VAQPLISKALAQMPMPGMNLVMFNCSDVSDRVSPWVCVVQDIGRVLGLT